MNSKYRGRLAPTPTGDLHLGHAATFYHAWQRARSRGGEILLRFEDLDTSRCKPEYVRRQIQDLKWLGIDWDSAPLFQTQRRRLYLEAWKSLRDGGYIYPCRRSRREVASVAPHAEEPLYPKEWRMPCENSLNHSSPEGTQWRFRVPDGEVISYQDGRCGHLSYIAGEDFGDFLIWNRHNIPAYELAVVVDDIDSGITEVVRGEDLLISTARQILLARALGFGFPATFHTELICDHEGKRLAKRSQPQSLAHLRGSGESPERLLTSVIPCYPAME